MERPSDDELTAADRRLADAHPRDVLAWAVGRFPGKLLMATAFGAEGCCLIHLLAEVGRETTLINLDTGYQFPETLALRDRLRDRYGLTVELIQPELTVAEYEAEHGGPLHAHRPDQCCHDRKVLPLRKALDRHAPHAWISAVRRDQTETRATTARVVQWDAKFGLVKVNPLLNWTKRDVWKFVTDHDVPYNPLHDHGYPSVGCWPCTRAVQPGEDDRAGRWAGKVKKECGLHVIEVRDGAGI